MRILHIVTSLAPEWGGVARAVASLTEELAAGGHECQVVTTNLPRIAAPLRPAGVKIDVFSTSPLTAVWRGHSSDLRRYVATAVREFDLIHIHEPWNYPHYAAAQEARRHSKPYIITLHGALEPTAIRFKSFRKHVYYRLVQGQILRCAALLHAITDREAQHLRTLVPSRPVAVIPNGVSLREFDHLPPPVDFERLFPAVRGKRTVLFLGRLHPIKGLDLLAESFRLVTHKREDVCLVIAGPDEGGTRARLERGLAKAIKGGQVVFTGMLTDHARLAAFSRADVFVLPARSEVRGLVALEAMACRLPVVITDACGFTEVEQAEAGLSVPLQAEALASALTRLLDDPALRDKYGRNGRRLVESHYTWPRVAEQMIACYRSIAQ